MRKGVRNAQGRTDTEERFRGVEAESEPLVGRVEIVETPKLLPHPQIEIDDLKEWMTRRDQDGRRRRRRRWRWRRRRGPLHSVD